MMTRIYSYALAKTIYGIAFIVEATEKMLNIQTATPKKKKKMSDTFFNSPELPPTHRLAPFLECARRLAGKTEQTYTLLECYGYLCQAYARYFEAQPSQGIAGAGRATVWADTEEISTFNPVAGLTRYGTMPTATASSKEDLSDSDDDTDSEDENCCERHLPCCR